MSKLEILGALLFISGVLLFGLSYLAIGIYYSISTFTGPLGDVQIARTNIGINFPYFLSIIFMVFGFILYFLKDIKRIFHSLFIDNEE